VAGDDDGADGLAARLGHRFADPVLFHQALAHRSWCGEREGQPSNERLEFLGDAVLGMVVADHVYHRFPDLPEGALAKMRSAVVNARVLAEAATELELGDVLLLGKGEESSGGRAKVSILADALEAVIGAVYLDGGWAAARPLALRIVSERIERVAADPDTFDHKSQLQELAVARSGGPPRYAVVGSGPDHDRHYRAEVFVGDERRGVGEGPSKKEAEQEAALSALRELAGPGWPQTGVDSA
jgi:ribonuclease III